MKKISEPIIRKKQIGDTLYIVSSYGLEELKESIRKEIRKDVLGSIKREITCEKNEKISNIT